MAWAVYRNGEQYTGRYESKHDCEREAEYYRTFDRDWGESHEWEVREYVKPRSFGIFRVWPSGREEIANGPYTGSSADAFQDQVDRLNKRYPESSFYAREIGANEDIYEVPDTIPVTTKDALEEAGPEYWGAAWVSPSGTAYKVNYGNHSERARVLCVGLFPGRTLRRRDGEECDGAIYLSETLGWVRVAYEGNITDWNWNKIDVERLTNRQYDRLWDMLQNAKVAGRSEYVGNMNRTMMQQVREAV